jgi:hypothetical protein
MKIIFLFFFAPLFMFAFISFVSRALMILSGYLMAKALKGGREILLKPGELKMMPLWAVH